MRSICPCANPAKPPFYDVPLPVPKRISAEAVRTQMIAGEDILLVSVYPEKVHRFSHIEGAISLEELSQRLISLDRTANLVFY